MFASRQIGQLGVHFQPNKYVIVDCTELRKVFVCFAKQQPGRARQKFIATTYKDFFSAEMFFVFLQFAL